MSNPKAIAPKDCNHEQICLIKTDNFSTPQFWISADGLEVSICKQRNGEPPEAIVSVPIKTFNKMIEWYQTPQETTESKPLREKPLRDFEDMRKERDDLKRELKPTVDLLKRCNVRIPAPYVSNFTEELAAQIAILERLIKG